MRLFFDWRDFQPYHLGLAVAAMLAGAAIVLLLPRPRRRPFVLAVATGWLCGFFIGAILIALSHVPLVGYFLWIGLNKLIPYAWRAGIRLPPYGIVVLVCNATGLLVGIVAGVLIAWLPTRPLAAGHAN